MEQKTFLKVDDKYYVSATSTYADDRVRVLNDADTFGVFDRWGDIQPFGQEVQGLYHEGTRFLSHFELQINGERPLLLSSTIKEENEILSVDLTNPDFLEAGEKVLRGTLFIGRKKFIKHGSCYETIQLTNFDTKEHTLDLTLFAAADFKDIFEVRGMERKRRGKLLVSLTDEDRNLMLRYIGLDNITRATLIHFQTPPHRIADDQIYYQIKLLPQQTYEIAYSITMRVGNKTTQAITHNEAYEKITRNLVEAKENITSIYTSNEQFNHWINRSETDLISLLADTPHGKYPYAGVPWYNTAFGRDGILTAYETLWIGPNIARGVLQYLAKTQATVLDPARDAEPGKIFHETRGGEMVELNELPFKLYYGTIDATPLFIVLAGAYYRRTGDLKTIQGIWPNIQAALRWIDEFGDLDGDGFIEYQHKSENGLTNQGWKDSFDSVSHANGNLADPPIALCEVQGYVYDAKLKAADLARALGDIALAQQLAEQAEALKKKFNETFWDEALQTYVLALDGDKKPCRVKSSNAGHCLFSGIVDEDKAPRLARTLLSDEMFSGWGVRTLGTQEVRYNPMSYHNGSVWPHDVAIIAYGLSQYGFQEEANQLMTSLFDASLFIDLQRLPELYCGFERRQGEGPTAYPVACSPQAWSVAAVFLLLKSCLRIDIDAIEKKITFNNPELPPYLKNVQIDNLKLCDQNCAIELHRYRKDVSISIIDKPADWQIMIIK